MIKELTIAFRSTFKKKLTLFFLSLFLLSLISSLTACGFQLRADSKKSLSNSVINQTVINRAVTIHTTNDRTSMAIKQPLSNQLNMLGITTLNEASSSDKSQSNSDISNDTPTNITVNALNFRKYELVGVLTEVRVVLVAEVTYDMVKDGKRLSHIQPLQIEKSYQYNEASVSVEDQQGNQIREWLYEALARRISDQYVALSK